MSVRGEPDLPPWLDPVARALPGLTALELSPKLPGPPGDARASAVLMLFGDDGVDGAPEPYLLLTERSHTMRSHAAQVSFPGGSVDAADRDSVETALREAHEEVGVDPVGVQVIGVLPPLWLPPSNFSVRTVVAYWREPHLVAPVDPAEVHSVFKAPLRTLLDPDNRFSVRHPSGWTGPAFAVSDGLLLWGFTAGIVAGLLARVGWERPWDSSVLRPLPARFHLGDTGPLR